MMMNIIFLSWAPLRRVALGPSTALALRLKVGGNTVLPLDALMGSGAVQSLSELLLSRWVNLEMMPQFSSMLLNGFSWSLPCQSRFLETFLVHYPWKHTLKKKLFQLNIYFRSSLHFLMESVNLFFDLWDDVAYIHGRVIWLILIG